MGVLPISAQIVDEQGRYVDTVFHDNVDRTAEDFVIASVLVVDPGSVLYSVLGHSSIRLQCPTFDMDYCFTYESEDERQKILSFLAGKLKMGLFIIDFDDYCNIYSKDGRGVYEYKLNLPINVKRELWRVLEENLQKEMQVPYDYLNRGCAIKIKDFVKEALGEMVIEYDDSLYTYSPTARELCIKNSKRALWVQFVALFLVGNDADIPLIGEKQLIIPKDLVNAWQKATVNGELLLSNEPTILVEGQPQVDDVWFTPMVLAFVLLLLAVVNLFWDRPYFDWLMLIVQTIVGCVMIYLIAFSELCCTDWNWLVIPFNPLVVIFWYWRKYWALPYVCVLVVWCVVMSAITIWGHVLVDWSHIIMVLSFVIVMIKQSSVFLSLLDNNRVNNN